MSSAAVRRIEEKLQASKDQRNFYETHQLYTTLYYRYNSKQRYQEARDLVTTGALYLFEYEHFGSAAHLSLLYIESLEKHVKEITDSDVRTIGTLHQQMKRDMSELDIFASRAIVWSSKCDAEPTSGNKTLRKVIAKSYWEKQMYEEAHQHYLYANAGTQFGQMLKELSFRYGSPMEIDMFLAQAVLQLLCIRSVEAANECFASYVKLHPDVSGPPYQHPLINFLSFLLIAIKDGKLLIFQILVDKYIHVLQKDDLYVDYLNKIGANYFGLKIPKQEKGGILENLMQSLFDDGPKQSSTEEKPTTSSLMTVEDLD